MNERVFTADYDRSDVLTRVWLPLGAAAILGMGGLLLAYPIASFLAAALTLIALRSWPLTRDNRPALRLSSEGAEIDGLGLVKWKDISNIEGGMVQVKEQKIPALDIEFRRPITEVFQATAATRLRPWEIRVFKLRQDGKLRLDLGKLDDDANEVQGAFRHFVSGTV